MTTPPSPDHRPTTVLPQQTVEQPAVVTAPATRRSRVWSHVPARLGRARTSTVVIGCLFVILLAVNAALPREAGGSVPVVLPSGQTVDVPRSALPEDAVPATTAPTRTAPASTPAPVPTSAPASTSRAPQTTDDDPESTPSQTTRAPNRSSSAPATTSRAPSTSSAPSSSPEPSAQDEPTETSSAPTS
jgi:hypothetical protein